MKKLLSTIGLGIALMTGFAPSLAEAAVVSLSGAPGPNTWNYDVSAISGEFDLGSTVTLTTGGLLTSVSTFSDNGITWTGAISGIGNNIATWTASGTSASTSFTGFSITSLDPNGTVNWAVSTGGAGTTQGPVPEPATVMLLGIGGLLAGGRKLYQTRTEEITA
ncbi:MAG: PEP-CTERM sorting domain-containing protein [Chlorobaculum sp.]|nr:PEP-CTERM sorting domain-containing protein [Chlorobaculum sp.]